MLYVASFETAAPAAPAHPPKQAPHDAVFRAQRPAQRTDPAKAYAEAHFDCRVSLQTAAERCHMSKYEFARAFKREHGTTFVDFVLRLRAHKAADLLRQGKTSVKQVGFAVGFNGASYFGRMFRRYYGMTPKQYQAWLRAEAARVARSAARLAPPSALQADAIALLFA